MAYLTFDHEFDIRDCDFDDDELIEELESRDYRVYKDHQIDDDVVQLLRTVWKLRREGQDYQSALDELIYLTLGKIV